MFYDEYAHIPIYIDKQTSKKHTQTNEKNTQAHSKTNAYTILKDKNTDKWKDKHTAKLKDEHTDKLKDKHTDV